jgi:hypothetical protein
LPAKVCKSNPPAKEKPCKLGAFKKEGGFTGQRILNYNGLFPAPGLRGAIFPNPLEDRMENIPSAPQFEPFGKSRLKFVKILAGLLAIGLVFLFAKWLWS